MDKFYKTSHLTLSQKKELLIKAKEKSFKWLPNILDLSKDYSRVYINKNFDELLEKVEEGTYVLFILREGDDWISEDPTYLEVGFRTMTVPDYFLFIYVKSGWLEYFVNGYDLKPMI